MLAFLLPLLLILQQQPPQPQQYPPAPPDTEKDETPSDPAAIGFLRGYVDEQVYNLPLQGVQQLRGSARVEIVGFHQEFEFEVHSDFITGDLRITLKDKSPPPGTENLLAEMFPIASNVFPLTDRFSIGTVDYITDLSQEGEEIRIDMKPRVEIEGAYPRTIWFREDGVPIRQQSKSTAGMEVALRFEFREVDGKLLRVRDVIDGGKATVSYEYTDVSGYHVPSRLTYREQGKTVVVHYNLQVSPPR